MQVAKVTTRASPSDFLQTKYFCKVDHEKKMEAVMQLSCCEVNAVKAIQYRYVLVIDVSGSMGLSLPRSNMTLLDRIKIFAGTFVERMNEHSSFSIVTFSDVANIQMGMTRANSQRKKKARDIIQKLEASGGTNLSEGIFEGLQTTKRKSPEKPTRDCIILFTDGAASDGILDPDQLVLAYNQLFGSEKSRVPIAAFTIGSYHPYLLHEVSLRLGSEAFYWLNENFDFEADLFIPAFLRKRTFITDITVHLTCLKGVTFKSSAISQQFLQTEVGSDHLKELTYFMHVIPGELKKHIPLVLNIPGEPELKGQMILKVRTTFLDFHLKEQEIIEFLELSFKTMGKLPSKSKKESNQQAVDILQSTSAYCVTGSKADVSWLSAQEAFAKVYHEKCRVITAESLKETCKLMKEETVDIQQIKSKMKGAINGIEKVKNTLSITLGWENEVSRELREDADELKSILVFAKDIMREENWGRLASMQSAISAEMPSATGVFDPRKSQPYMPSHVMEDIQKYRRLMKTKKKPVWKRPIEKKIFKGRYMALSKDLWRKQMGPKRESFEERIIKFGGTPVPRVGTMRNNTILISSKQAFNSKTVEVRDALNSKVPVVKEEFIHDCIKQLTILEMDDYVFAK